MRLFVLAVAAIVLVSCVGDAPPASPLMTRLRAGGLVVAMRHTASPLAPPDAASADPGNPNLERQLDDSGKRAAKEIGAAIARRRIPIGKVFSSTTFRALQTAALAKLPNATPTKELSEGEQGMMAADNDETRAAWLRAAVRAKPQGKTNTFLITHTPNLVAAFADDAKGLGAGDALVFKPDGKGGTLLLGRISVADWIAIP